MAGAMTPTAAGEIAVARAEAIEAEIGSLSFAVEGMDVAAMGAVRVTAGPFLINRLLIPAAAALLDAHPRLQLELIGDSRNLSLTRREADIALRLARPASQAGSRTIAKRIATLDYGIYVASEYPGDAERLPWLTYEDSMAHFPHAQWLAAAAERDENRAPVLVNEAEGLIHTASAGLGRALLPRLVADGISGLRRLPDAADLPKRELWLLTHSDIRHLVRIRVVSDWIEATLSRRSYEAG
jgi:DNA-binding transcriptional LysR family regulator